MPGYRDLLQQVKSEIDEVDAPAAAGLLEGDDAPILLDVRELHEWQEGHIPGAVHIPRGFLESQAEQALPDHDRPVVVYCAGGSRSAFAAKTLGEMGYETVYSLAGGYTDWKRNGFPTVLPRTLDTDKRQRYSRHLLIPEVGEEGQIKLLDSRMLLIGAGGLGSPASLYLAAAGVGTLGIVDDDVVDATNLQRQIVHSTERLGESKAESAKQTIEALNPDVQVRLFKERLTSENVDRILGEGWDVIVDGADNFPTRYLLNDASVWHRIPIVHGSIFRFEGQVTVFKPYEGPCYRCLFPQPPPPELAPSCAEGGVLGVLPGIVGSLQANEAIKLALGIGDSARRPAAPLRRARALVHRGQAAARPGLPRLRRVADDHRVHRLRRVLPGAPGGGRTDGRLSASPPRCAPRPAARARSRRPATRSATCSTTSASASPACAARCSTDGEIAPFVNVYVEGEDVRTLDGLETEVADGSTVILLPAMAGGQRVDLAPSLLELVGHTPLVELARLSPPGVSIYAKLEGQNPTGSIKDRVAKAMIEAAEASGELQPGRELLEPTSGNTGISLAFIARLKGYRLTCVMPENATEERKRLLRLYGAEIIDSPAAEGSNGAVRLALELAAREPRYYMPFQYANEANPRAHYEGTGAEIAEALDRVDVLVAGLGTGGTLMGTGERLRESFPDVVVAAAEPLPGDPVMGLRSLEDGYVPPILDVSKLDRKLLVSNAESVAGLRALLEREGIFAGVSAGAVVHVARRLAEEADEGAVVVCILADAGWKYLSADFWDAPDPEASMESGHWW